MGVTSETLRKLAGLNLSAEQMAGVLELLADSLEKEEVVREKIAAKTRLYRKRGGGNIPDELRKAVYERDGYKCVYCDAESNLSCDHIHPLSKGGETTLENLATACIPCNSRKRDRERKRYSKEFPRNEHGNSNDSPSPLVPPLVSPIPPSELPPIIPPTPAALLTRARGGQKTDFQIIYETGIATFPRLATASTAAIRRWITDGFSPELDILPVIERFATTGKDIGTWDYFSRPIADERKTRETKTPEGRAKGLGHAVRTRESSHDVMGRAWAAAGGIIAG